MPPRLVNPVFILKVNIMQYDWSAYRSTKNKLRPARRRCRRLRYIIVPLLAILATVGLSSNRSAVPETEARTAPLETRIAPPPLPEAKIEVEEKKNEVIEGAIRPGDTISSILSDYFSPEEIHNLARESRETFPLSGICAGQPYKICIKDGDFESFEYDIDRDAQLIIRKDEEKFDISRIPIAYEVKTETVRGTISTSLFEAVAEAKENPELAIALAEIFAYDVDFIRDIRHGDSFQAIVEKRYRDGTPAGYGQILAAEFTNQGKSFRAFFFRDGDRAAAYYDEAGNSLRTAFLRAPLSFSRISSGYTLKRFHPIAKVWRAHPAIDYAAPTGTPIKTVGDGTIVRMGYQQGNGNHVRVRHANGYETMYLHMSRFAKGMKAGRRVKQGETIGYVGSTGLATGPHLCFRMYRNGDPINPNSVKTTAAAPVSRARMGAFRTTISPLLAMLDGNEIRQAQADQADPSPTVTEIP